MSMIMPDRNGLAYSSTFRNQAETAYHAIRLLLNAEEPWIERVLAGVSGFVHDQRSWFLDVRRSGRVPADPSRVSGNEISGLIACGFTGEALEAYRATGVPVVAVSLRQGACRGIPGVVIDESRCGELAAAHFIEHGYSDFGYLGDASDDVGADLLIKGFTRAVADTGKSCQQLLLDPDRGINDKIAQVCNWLRRLPEPVAVLGYDANHAQLLVEACRRLGRRSPESVGLLSGEDDLLAQSITTVDLSAIDRGYRAAGWAAGELLHKVLAGERVSFKPSLVEPGGVVERESTETLAVSDQVVAAAIRYIRSNVSEPIQVIDVVEAVGMSRRALEKRFLQAAKRTPAEEIRRWRIKKVKKLLAETTMPIQDIATASGFVYPEVMQRTFKRVVGMVPSDYRRQHQRVPVA